MHPCNICSLHMSLLDRVFGTAYPAFWCQQKGQSQLVAVIPPGALSGNQHAIRVLQVGAATCSCPADR